MGGLEPDYCDLIVCARRECTAFDKRLCSLRMYIVAIWNLHVDTAATAVITCGSCDEDVDHGDTTSYGGSGKYK